MRKVLIEKSLEKQLSKLFRKDKQLYDAVFKKVQELSQSSNLHTYKNLRAPLQNYKRIHITGTHVLLFRFLEAKNLLVLVDFEHRDKVYGKKR